MSRRRWILKYFGIGSNHFFSQSLDQTLGKAPLLPQSSLSFSKPKNALQTVSGISIAVLLDAAFLKA